MSEREILPDPEVCECGYRVKWFVPLDDSDHMPDWWILPGKMETDVVEQDCPHGNGTVLEHCPQCDGVVGMWGFGAAGSMECSCWLQDVTLVEASDG